MTAPLSDTKRAIQRRQERAFYTKVWGISSFGLLREMLLTATPAEAKVINERLTERAMHRAASRRKKAARLQAAAEAEQAARLAR